MRKLLSLFVAAGVLSAANVMAKDFDLTAAAQKAQSKIDATTKKIEDAKAEKAKKDADAQKAREEKLEAKKAKYEAKKAEIEKKLKAQQEESAAKKAEQQKAIDDAKGSLNNLKNALTAE